MSAVDLAGAYAGFANKGHSVKPYFITEIKDKYGKTLATFEPKVSAKPAFSRTTGQVMIEMMKATVNEGTAARLRYKYRLPNDIAGKTGTTQDNKDGWFVGITPNLISVTWAGADDHRIGFPSTSIGQGANSALPAFALMMQKMNADPKFSEITQARFPEPSERVQQMLDCEPLERDNFLERLFSGADDPSRDDSEDDKKKKGLFNAIKGIFKKKE